MLKFVGSIAHAVGIASWGIRANTGIAMTKFGLRIYWAFALEILIDIRDLFLNVSVDTN